MTHVAGVLVETRTRVEVPVRVRAQVEARIHVEAQIPARAPVPDEVRAQGETGGLLAGELGVMGVHWALDVAVREIGLKIPGFLTTLPSRSLTVRW